VEATLQDRPPILSFSKSVVLHALIAWLIYYLMTQNPDDGVQHSAPIEVTSVDAKPQRKIVHSEKARVHPTETAPKRSHEVSLSDLGMRLNTDPVPEQNNTPEESRPSADAANDDEGWDVMNPDPRVARFNQYIYNTVQGWLDRDAYLNSKPLYGTVKLKIWFTKDGEYLEDETIFDAIDEDFREIVKRALRKSFANPIPHPFLYQKEKFSIVRQVVVRR
jgi:hypothetical protein